MGQPTILFGIFLLYLVIAVTGELRVHFYNFLEKKSCFP